MSGGGVVTRPGQAGVAYLARPTRTQARTDRECKLLKRDAAFNKNDLMWV